MTLREAAQMALNALEHLQTDIEWQYKSPTRAMLRKVEKALRAALANEFNPDWDQVEALQESLREHMAEIQRLRAALAQPEQRPVAWKDVKDYESQYEVSSSGDIRNKKTGTILSKSLMGAGYVKADLWKDGVRWQTSAHRIVASAFVDNPEMLDEVNHINGDKTDNRACNLEWVSRSQNVIHSYYKLGNNIKKIVATNIETGDIKIYQSVESAVRDGFQSAHINEVIAGKRKQHKGFAFAEYAPQQREWQGLTDEEQGEVAWSCGAMSADWLDFARAIEAKLKEKNT